MNRLIEYAGHHSLLFTGAVAMALVVIVYELRERSQGRAALAPQEVIRLMNHGALVIDLRTGEKYSSGHISGAKAMTGEEILKAGETLKRYREKPVIVYCDSGSLSAAAVRQLGEQGFKSAFNLRGGLAAWRSENLPLARD
jgi:rhodanese-related sulfurtransferase